MQLFVTIAALAATAVAAWSLWQLRTVAAALHTAAATLAEAVENGGSTDPKLLERIESAERRVGEMSDDINRRYRKLAQERRRMAALTGEDPDDDEGDPVDTPAAVQALRAQLGAQGEERPNGRRTLRRRR